LLRLEFAGVLYHITSRGDRREPIYEDDEDRQKFLLLLDEVCDSYNWECHAVQLRDFSIINSLLLIQSQIRI
jgi:hypothetical protein